jgi:hypothetical protein
MNQAGKTIFRLREALAASEAKVEEQAQSILYLVANVRMARDEKCHQEAMLAEARKRIEEEAVDPVMLQEIGKLKAERDSALRELAEMKAKEAGR